MPSPRQADTGGYIRSVELKRDRVPSFREYPYSIPAIRNLRSIDLHPRVTFFVGENGSGKSTLLEAVAAAWGLNPEGGSRNFVFATRESHSELFKRIRLVKGVFRPGDAFFLRAESYFNVATELDRLESESGGILGGYGGVSLHEMSHGESFLALLAHRFRKNGLYLLDEPEAALSPARQLAALGLIHRLVRDGAQLVVATHSPILMAYPDATILNFSEDGIAPIAYEETEHYSVVRGFLDRRESMLRSILDED